MRSSADYSEMQGFPRVLRRVLRFHERSVEEMRGFLEFLRRVLRFRVQRANLPSRIFGHGKTHPPARIRNFGVARGGGGALKPLRRRARLFSLTRTL